MGCRLNNDGTAGVTNYVGCHHGSEVPVDTYYNGMIFLNSEITFGDVYDGSSITILVSEALKNTSADLGWASGTRSSLRNDTEVLDFIDWFSSPRQADAGADDFVGGFSSPHLGICNFVMARVRFIVLAPRSILSF